MNPVSVPRSLAIAQRLDLIARACGRLAAWLCLLMALATGLVVALRYGFKFGSQALQESVNYLHAAVFMLGAAYTLQRDAHVRVDIFYRRWSPRTRAWVDCIGNIVFLAPMCVFIVWVSWTYVSNSWAIRESSADPGGLPAVFLLKSLIPLLSVTLLLQGLAEIMRRLALLSAPVSTPSISSPLDHSTDGNSSPNG
jgi:TRAP-type mannitol/chloroaromatic compound transport system permease small subunit